MLPTVLGLDVQGLGIALMAKIYAGTATRPTKKV